ncbi:hypothetical protein H4Q26_005505 [Puccinia striiformis f. sp. tritici PST-130]|nr:hypothetical protein H4Q26_005505 [Puccinia striiformis f. sp. tritici PST-130]
MAHLICDVQSVSILGKPSIRLGYHLAPYIAHTVLTELRSSTYILITDSNVSPRHVPALKAAFEDQLPAKCREMKAVLEDWLLDHRCTRDTVVLALGGGVIGDLIGFVSATFMRGIRFCQIPTTLLAMVDSSVGGKTAIDTPLGKNLVGAFWQPSFIFIDASYLETLPEREFVNGMAEMIKTAAIWMNLNVGSRSQAQNLLLEVIADSVGVKSEVVTKDEKETGLRNLVNFGHTIGHASKPCRSRTWLLILKRRRSSKQMSQSSWLARLLERPEDPELTKRIQTQSRSPLGLMSVDKKNEGKVKKIVLLSRIGKTFEERATGVEDSLIRRVLAPAVRVYPGPPPANIKEVTLRTPGSKSISNRA